MRYAFPHAIRPSGVGEENFPYSKVNSASPLLNPAFARGRGSRYTNQSSHNRFNMPAEQPTQKDLIAEIDAAKEADNIAFDLGANGGSKPLTRKRIWYDHPGVRNVTFTACRPTGF